jgi:hypothetical protein
MVDNYIQETEDTIEYPSDPNAVTEINNNIFIQENFRPYFAETHDPNQFLAQLPINSSTEVLKFDMQTKIIFREINSQFSFYGKDPFNFINNVNMKKLCKKVLDYGDRISSIPFTSRLHIENPYKVRDEKDVFFNSDPYLTSIIVRITYLDYVVELVDFRCLIWFCALNYDPFYNLLNDRNNNYNIVCKRSKRSRYSFKNKVNGIQFNFAKVYLSLDRKRLLKVTIQYRLENQRLMWQYSKIFNEEYDDGENNFPHIDLY